MHGARSAATRSVPDEHPAAAVTAVLAAALRNPLMRDSDRAPMEIVLHVGPHKTGTTTVQQFLHDNLADDHPQPGHWYPRPDRNGPGHARLAWQTLGSPAHRTEASDALGMLVDRAAAAGT